MRLIFGDCVLDLERQEFYRGGALLHIRAKVFNILSFLIANRDRVLSRDELLAHGWPGLTVSDSTLSNCIVSLRRAIGDDVRNPRFVKTLHGRGLRFIAEVTVEEADAPAVPVHARGDSLSIAVLPFANLNGDPKLDYLADGLAEDITAELSRFKAFIVIARNSAFQYRGPANDIQKIGAELRVDYILEGSVRCRDDAFRATAQLIHAPTARQLWAGNYDGRIDRLFALQNDISQAIATNIMPEIDMAEIRRASDSRATDSNAGNLRAQEMAWRARALLDRWRAEADLTFYDEGVALAEAAAALDPRCRQAWWTISFANYVRAFARQGDNPEALLARAREAAEKLRMLDRNDHSAYMSLGWVNFIERDFGRAVTNLDQAHALNPNCTMTLMLMGVIATSSGNPQAGFDHLGRAMRLSPRDLFLGFMLAGQAFSCFALARFEEGVEISRRAIEREPHAPANHIILAACLAEIGDLANATVAIRAQRRINEPLLRQYLSGQRLPFKDATVAERYTAALRRAAQTADPGG